MKNEERALPYIVDVEVGGFSQPIWDNRLDNQDQEAKRFNQGWRKSDPYEIKIHQ